MKWPQVAKTSAMYTLAAAPFILSARAIYGLVADGYSPRVMSIAIASAIAGLFLAVWVTRNHPWQWIKQHWYMPLVGCVVISQIIAMLHEGFTAQRLNTIVWMISAGIFWELGQSWRRLYLGQKTLSAKWEELYFKTKETSHAICSAEHHRPL